MTMLIIGVLAMSLVHFYPAAAPDPAAPVANVRLVLLAAAVFAAVLYLHGWLFGVAVRAYY